MYSEKNTYILGMYKSMLFSMDPKISHIICSFESCNSIDQLNVQIENSYSCFGGISPLLISHYNLISTDVVLNVHVTKFKNPHSAKRTYSKAKNKSTMYCLRKLSSTI